MNATTTFPFHLHWNSQQIADAVPPRLFELDLFACGDDSAACANAGSASQPRRRTSSYLPASGLPAQFRVCG